MKKNKIFTLENILVALAVICGIVAICMMFVNSVGLGAKTSSGTISADPVYYTGVEATFGKEYVFGFSFMNLLTYILTLVAVILALFKMFGLMKNKASNYIIALLFVVAGVFFFCSGAFSVLAENTDRVAEAVSSIVTTTKSITTGAIIAGILSICAGVLTLIPAFTGNGKKKKK